MELELKFALALQDPRLLEKQLARCALIGKRPPRRQALHSTYYDTPEHALHRAAVALRVRQIGDGADTQWVQTLKMGGSRAGAFSQRGEWEAPLPSSQLSSALLAATPWQELDTDGSLLQNLAPLFTTRFERLSWEVAIGASRVEVALDLGQVDMDGYSTPLCELEIELLSGTPDALFDVAWHISQHLCLLPLHMSKAERAYRLAAGTLDEPLRARPPTLTRHMELGVVLQSVLRESFLQFSANLYSLRGSDAPEVLHQARVGWRRFKSGLQLFKLRGKHSPLPDLAPLQALLTHMAQVRDLEVAASEVFPAYVSSYQGKNARRIAQWQRLEAALAKEIARQRNTLRQHLCDPAVGRTLLLVTRWLEIDGVQNPQRSGKDKPTPSKWLRKRVGRMAEQLQDSAARSSSPMALHRVRIQSKRLRYGVESLRSLLPQKRAERWYRLAVQLQTDLGLARDQQLAVAIAERLHAARSILDHLRQASAQACADPA